MKRPKSVTIVCWLLIVTSALALITSTLTMDNPEARELMSRSPIPISFQYALLYFGLLVQVVSGFAMLYGKNWGRLLYVIWGGIGLLIGVVTSPMKAALIPGIVIFAVFVFFLFRAKANEYFRAVSTTGTTGDAQGT